MGEVPKYISYDWNLTIPSRTVKTVYKDGQWYGEEEIPNPEPPKNATHLRIEVIKLTGGSEQEIWLGCRKVPPRFRMEAEVEFTLYVNGAASRQATFITSAHDRNGDDEARAEFIRNWRLDHIAWLEETSSATPDYETMSVEIVDRNDFLKWLGLDLAAIFKSATNEKDNFTAPAALPGGMSADKNPGAR